MKLLRAFGSIGGVVAALALALAACERELPRAPSAGRPVGNSDAATPPARERRADAPPADYVAASKALAATLQATAGTAAQYGELARLGYLAGDFAMAESAIAKGLALAPTPKLRSALFYYRGRVAQATGRLPEAAAAFGEATAADDNPEAAYWQEALPSDGAVVAGDAKTVCAALVALTALAQEVAPARVACEVADPATVFPAVATAALLGRVAVVRFTADGASNELVYALWQQAEAFAVRGVISLSLGEALHRSLLLVERLGEHLVVHTELKGNSRASSFLASEVDYCPAGARPCSLRVRTSYEEYPEGRADEAAAVAWMVGYEVSSGGLLRVTPKAGTPPAGLVGEHRIF